MLIATETGTSASQAVKNYSLKEPVEGQPTSTDLVEMLNSWNSGQVVPKDYSQSFLESLPQAPECYNAEDLNEMFKVWQKDSRPAFILSETMRERGEELSETEAIVIDTAQTLRKSFKNGVPVSLRQIRRVIVRYHQALRVSDIKEAVRRLSKRKVCRSGKQQLSLVDSFSKSKRPVPSKFSRLATTNGQELLLLCCRDLVAYFTNGNTCPRVAIQALMQARHHQGKSQANKLIRDLIASGVLLEVITHGASGLRLTSDAITFLKSDAGTFAKTERPIVEPEPEQPQPELEESLFERVCDAFNHVAFNGVCALPVLLQETRKRDIRDSDVKSLISSEESYKRGSFNCRRSANGKLFIDSGTWCEVGTLASISELFAELEA